MRSRESTRHSNAISPPNLYANGTKLGVHQPQAETRPTIYVMCVLEATHHTRLNYLLWLLINKRSSFPSERPGVSNIVCALNVASRFPIYWQLNAELPSGPVHPSFEEIGSSSSSEMRTAMMAFNSFLYCMDFFRHGCLPLGSS